MTIPTPSGRPRPYQRHRVRRPAPDVAVTGGAPLAQVTIYDDLILLARRERAGGAWRQYPVTAEALAQSLAGLPSGGGLLPPNTLAAGVVHGRPFAAIWIAPGLATLQTEARSYALPLPPLVWAGCGDDYRVFALGEQGVTFPTVGNQPLFCAPMPNTYSSGAICWGSSDPRPEASPAMLRQAWKIFVESYFNAHVQEGKSRAYPKSILAQWADLISAGAERYPLDDLVPAGAGATLDWLCQGGPWGGVR